MNDELKHKAEGALGKGKEKLGVSPQWGRHIVEVLCACEESSRTGREVKIESRGIEAPVGASR